MSAAHLFSVDVEEHFQVSAFERYVPRSSWDHHPSRVERNTDRLLDLLARCGSTATFFTLGWVAKRCPGLVRRITEQGHEVASHSWWHGRVSTLSRKEFSRELRSSREILEDVSGAPVHGFRAPSFSIRPGMEWAFDALLEEGYTYDSSLFPIRRPDYGYPPAAPGPHWIARPAGRLLELPMLTLDLFGQRLPAAGGGYLRHLPEGIMHRALAARAAEGQTGMMYVHPWEVDPDQPRLPVGFLTRMRHYGGLHRTLPRLERLFAAHRFVSVARWVADGNPA